MNKLGLDDELEWGQVHAILYIVSNSAIQYPGYDTIDMCYTRDI